jgi:hypothetical protein
MIVQDTAMTVIELRRTPIMAATPNAVSPVGGMPALAQPAKIATVAAVAAVPPITVLHLTATGPVEPIGWTISDYVVTLPYGTALYAMTVGALAIGGGILVRGLAQLGRTRSVRVLLAAWAAALLTTAVFRPTIGVRRRPSPRRCIWSPVLLSSRHCRSPACCWLVGSGRSPAGPR